MQVGRSLRWLVAVAVLGAACGGAAWGQSATTIPKDAVVQPAALHQELAAHPHAALILQVGSRMMFDQGHIPGSEYAGPGSQPEGLQALRMRVGSLPRSKPIVLYCGCCPWDKCPNVAPAWDLLHGMGFTHVRVLYLANNFGADWVARGYAADRAQ
ncbi:MAG: rhodanese-like domain-containing protein [Acidobacteriota bacterium]